MNIIKQDIGVWVKAVDNIFPKESAMITMRSENNIPWTEYVNIKRLEKEYWKKSKIEWLKPIEQVYVLTGDELEHLLYEYLDDTFETAEQFLKSITTIK